MVKTQFSVMRNFAAITAMRFSKAAGTAAIIAVLAAFTLVSCDGVITDSGNWSGALGVPSRVTATAESSSVITLSWSPVYGALGYHVYHSPRRSGPYYVGITVSSPQARHYDLSANTTHYYRVAAYNNVEEGPQSVTVQATTFSYYPGGGQNPFVGTWYGYQHDGEPIRVVIGTSTWTISWPYHPDWVLEEYGVNTGTYTYSGTTASTATAVFRINSNAIGTGTVSGSYMSLHITGYGPVTLSR